jgi:hypothetical protein
MQGSAGGAQSTVHKTDELNKANLLHFVTDDELQLVKLAKLN